MAQSQTGDLHFDGSSWWRIIRFPSGRVGWERLVPEAAGDDAYHLCLRDRRPGETFEEWRARMQALLEQAVREFVAREAKRGT